MLFFAILEAVLCLTASVSIVLYDLRRHLITNFSLFCFGLSVLALKVSESLLRQDNFLGVILAGSSALILFLVIYWVSGKSMGLGDVKLAVVLAFLVNPGSIRMFFLWISMIWIFGGMHGLASAFRHRTIRRKIAFAPALFVGTFTYLAMGIWSSLPQ